MRNPLLHLSPCDGGGDGKGTARGRTRINASQRRPEASLVVVDAACGHVGALCDMVSSAVNSWDAGPLSVGQACSGERRNLCERSVTDGNVDMHAALSRSSQDSLGIRRLLELADHEGRPHGPAEPPRPATGPGRIENQAAQCHRTGHQGFKSMQPESMVPDNRAAASWISGKSIMFPERCGIVQTSIHAGRGAGRAS